MWSHINGEKKEWKSNCECKMNEKEREKERIGQTWHLSIYLSKFSADLNCSFLDIHWGRMKTMLTMNVNSTKQPSEFFLFVECIICRTFGNGKETMNFVMKKVKLVPKPRMYILALYVNSRYYVYKTWKLDFFAVSLNFSLNYMWIFF